MAWIYFNSISDNLITSYMSNILNLIPNDAPYEIFHLLAPCALATFGMYIFGQYREKRALRRDLKAELKAIRDICSCPLPKATLECDNILQPCPVLHIHTKVFDNKAGKIGLLGTSVSYKTIAAYAKTKALNDALQSYNRVYEAHANLNPNHLSPVCLRILVLQKDAIDAIDEATAELSPSKYFIAMFFRCLLKWSRKLCDCCLNALKSKIH